MQGSFDRSHGSFDRIHGSLHVYTGERWEMRVSACNECGAGAFSRYASVRVCLSVSASLCLCLSVSLSLYLSVFLPLHGLSVCASLSVCLNLCGSVCLYLCACLCCKYVRACVFMCRYVRTLLCMHVFSHVHAYVFICMCAPWKRNWISQILSVRKHANLDSPANFLSPVMPIPPSSSSAHSSKITPPSP